MKTTEIVKNLLEHAIATEWSYAVDNTQRYCLECGDETDWEYQQEHDPTCTLKKSMDAAEEYLKLMKVPA